jgi:hypothetical protein
VTNWWCIIDLLFISSEQAMYQCTNGTNKHPNHARSVWLAAHFARI